MAFTWANPKRSVREDLQIMEAIAARREATKLRSSDQAKRRTRLNGLGAALAAIGVFAGFGWNQQRLAGAAMQETERNLTGTWALKAVNGELIGPHVASDVLMQRVTFENGKLRGDTRLRANTAAGTTDMPFPDESAKSATTSSDGRYLDVAWEGVYTVLDSRRLELKIGKTGAIVEAHFDSGDRALEFDHDAILTVPGGVRYTRQQR